MKSPGKGLSFSSQKEIPIGRENVVLHVRNMTANGFNRCLFEPEKTHLQIL